MEILGILSILQSDRNLNIPFLFLIRPNFNERMYSYLKEAYVHKNAIQIAYIFYLPKMNLQTLLDIFLRIFKTCVDSGIQKTYIN
jgi:hypothetical protein